MNYSPPDSHPYGSPLKEALRNSKRRSAAARLSHEVGTAGADDDDLELGVLAKGGPLEFKARGDFRLEGLLYGGR